MYVGHLALAISFLRYIKEIQKIIYNSYIY